MSIKLLESDWSTKYHYWSERVTPSEIRKMKSMELYTIFKSLEKEANGTETYVTSFEQQIVNALDDDDGYSFEYDECSEIDLTLLIEKGIPLLRDAVLQWSTRKKDVYRRISVETLDTFNKSDLGVCWAWDEEGLDYYSSFINYKKYYIDLEGEVSPRNVDWMESIYLHIIYPCEHELRIKDPMKIKLNSYKIYDSETDELLEEKYRNE